MPKGFCKPRTILFDWDNTLIDAWSIIHNSMNATLLQFGYSAWTLEQTKANAQKSSRESFPELFGDQWQEAYKSFYTYFKESHLKELRVYEGSLDLLNFLKTKNIPTGIVSNKNRDVLRQEIEHLKWQNLFKAIVGSGDATYDKPAADPVLLALKQLEQTASPEVWFVGDTAVDWECAITAQCQPFVMGSIHKTIPYVQTCQELIDVLKNLL